MLRYPFHFQIKPRTSYLLLFNGIEKKETKTWKVHYESTRWLSFLIPKQTNEQEKNILSSLYVLVLVRFYIVKRIVLLCFLLLLSSLSFYKGYCFLPLKQVGCIENLKEQSSTYKFVLNPFILFLLTKRLIYPQYLYT